MNNLFVFEIHIIMIDPSSVRTFFASGKRDFNGLSLLSRFPCDRFIPVIYQIIIDCLVFEDAAFSLFIVFKCFMIIKICFLNIKEKTNFWLKLLKTNKLDGK